MKNYVHYNTTSETMAEYLLIVELHNAMKHLLECVNRTKAAPESFETLAKEVIRSLDDISFHLPNEIQMDRGKYLNLKRDIFD